MDNWLRIGRRVDFGTLEQKGQDFFLDPNDLTTHAFIVGMTGSGKTGTAIVILEELLRSGIPVVAIDPKGDLANLAVGSALHSSPSRKSDGGVPGAVEMEPRYEGIYGNAEALILTPGSSAGIPISIVQDLEFPSGLSWEEHEDVIVEKIGGMASALLLLANRDVDPLRSKEHTLISNIIEYCWRNEIKLDLESLLSYILHPPFSKIGLMDVEEFMSLKQRKELLTDLNTAVASPSFRFWLKGMPLDFDRILWSKSGRPRVSIFYLAHLDETQKMFAVTLILEALYTWLFKRGGSDILRYVLFFDEVYGYMPPYPSNPPSKRPLMFLMKQARAFGLGIILSTQNPVDIDYKILTNSGLWIIGRLQTDRDKRRLIEGLRMASALGSELTENDLYKLISLLKSRLFLFRNIRKNEIELVYVRKALTLLKGPLTLNEVKKISSMAHASGDFIALRMEDEKFSKYKHSHYKGLFTSLPPDTSSKITSLYLPPKFAWSGLKAYLPAILISYYIEFENRTPPVSYFTEGHIFVVPGYDFSVTDEAYGVKASSTISGETVKSWERDMLFLDISHMLRSKSLVSRMLREAKRTISVRNGITVYEVPSLKAHSKPNEDYEEFMLRIHENFLRYLEERRRDIKNKYERKIVRLSAQLERRRIQLEKLKERARASKLSPLKSIRSSKNTRANGMKWRELLSRIQRLEAELSLINRELLSVVRKMDAELREKATLNSIKVKRTNIRPPLKAIHIEDCILLWIPVGIDEETLIPVVNLYNGRKLVPLAT